MSKYRNIKIHVPTPEISEAVQRALSKDGCKWAGGLDIPSCLDYKFLFVSKSGLITREKDDEYFFKTHEHKDVLYQSILDPYYDVKIAWANGEVVQYKSRGEWHDWENMAALVTDIYSDWRIKPKTKTIKQWEYKKTIFEGKEVYTVVFRHKALAMESYRDCGTAITEPTLVEYEVPND